MKTRLPGKKKYPLPKVKHLHTTGVITLRKKNSKLSKPEARDILARALLHNDYKSLLKTYRISKKQKHFTDTEIYLGTFDYNITQRGFYFSEYCLMRDLAIDYYTAYNLKHKLDKLIVYNEFLDKKKKTNGAGYFDGNMRITGWERLSLAIEKFKQQKRLARLMGDWPLKFYGRYEPKYLIDFGKSGKREVSFLHVDSFFVESKEYFGSDQALEHFISRFIDLLVQLDNVAIDFESLKMFSKPVFQLITHHYQYRIGTIDSFWGRDKLLFLPWQQPKRFELNIFSFGQRLKRIRTERKMTQARLAEDSELSVRTIIRLEKDEHLPNLSTIHALAMALNVSTFELCSFQDHLQS